MSNLKTQAQSSVTKPTRMADFQQLFGKYQIQIEQIAPKKGIQSNRIIALAAQVFAASPMLQECDPKSMIAAVMQTAMMGLNPTPQWGEVYFVPYGKQVQMQVGYQGWIKLASKSGILKSIRANCIYEGDPHTTELGSVSKIVHSMGPNYGDPSKVVAVYAIAELRSGGEQFVILNKQMIERLRMKSPMQKNGMNGAWKSDYDKMSMAKAIKQLLKMIPREDEWRSFDFVDESIASLETLTPDGPTTFEYPENEGSAEVVAEPTEDEINQAALDAQLKKEGLFDQGGVK
jgi:recombination protein RecT